MASGGAGKAIRRGALVAVVLAAAALVLPPFVNVERYKGRVTESMSNALGRTVSCDSIELRLLPQPGFFLANVAIGDDAAYSSEPILHAEEVTAYLSPSSLWRGRLEIARLYLNYPSLNLVEREDASWNLESLLWKASRTKAAPTASPVSASRQRFPYIVATNGRINFKYGLAKSVFSFTEADFAVWSPAENQWRMRLEARPVRTDMPVTDTGTIKAEATMQRAELLRDAPMKATVTWERVQLGNLTRLIYGEDHGWRGGLEGSAQFSGTPSALHFTTAARLRDFRRFDISSGDAANLNASCEGEMNVSASLVQHTECRLPLDGGLVTVQGTMRGLHFPRYDVVISAGNLGANALLNLARRAKRNLPEDLTASGTVTASFHATRLTDAPSTWIGNLEINGLTVHSAVLGKDIVIGKAVATANTMEAPQPVKKRTRYSAPELHPALHPASPPVRALVVESFELPLGGSLPASIEGTLDDQHFALHLKGEATLERLQQFARAVGVDVPRIGLTGPASIDLVIGGMWDAFTSPQVTGTAQLKNARVEVPGLALPVEIAAARVELDDDRLTLRSASATVGKIALSGVASFPRWCDGEKACESGFDLSTDELNPERWNELLNPHLKKKPWYRPFAGEAKYNVIANLHASGHISARRLTLGTLAGSGFESAFTVANGALELKESRAEVLGGSVAGRWKIDFNGPQPKYESSGTATRIAAEKLAPLLKASLGTGTLSADYKLEMAGWDEAALLHSAAVESTFTWSGGTLRISPDGKALKVMTGEGKTNLGKDGWTISDCKWKTAGGIYQLRGTVSRDSALAVEFIEESGAVSKVSGTLLKPQAGAAVAEAPRVQAIRR